jgi:transposase
VASEAHVRIDEGIKRGPKKQGKIRPRRVNSQTGLAEAIPPGLDPKYVLDLYLQNPTTSGIAQKLGVRRSTLTLWLRKTCPEDWKNVQICKALMRKEDADEGLETAADALELARAREMLRSGQWDLERLDAANYGQKQEVTHQNAQPVLVITVAGQPPAELQVNPQSVVIEQQTTPSSIAINSKPLMDK